ncbi:Zinc finger protein 2 homolog [Eumeta japonica]|uniref:Zinc finger protein 2 homolog n=1 Tax=Eumeta variegata TaxID=151549 RepID=A0A4C1VY56_EUMVA|nr:Zinc finger protein 2 homolog [Eumeta japonica]
MKTIKLPGKNSLGGATGEIISEKICHTSVNTFSYFSDGTTSTKRTAPSDDAIHPDRHFTVRTSPQSQAKYYTCTKCDMSFRSERTCVTHVTEMHLDRRYPCPVCEQTFKNKTQSINHLAEIHGDADVGRDGRGFQCRICGKPLNSGDRLYAHMKHHILMTCRLCGLVPNTVKEMAEHQQEKHGVEIPTCGVCGYKNRSRHRVLRHQRKVHMKEKNLECDVCCMRFFDKSSLNKHMVCHKSARAHECEYCHKKFQRASTMNTHRKIHTGEKNKVCEVCGERFVQKASLNYHMMKRHPEAKY